MSDVVIAQQVVSGIKYNFGSEEMFHDTSAIYKISNERIQDYHKFLTNKKRMLSVIASGDQILCGILEGTEEIDAFDISRFPKYFLYLKIAGIQALNREEYVDFFYGCCNRDEIYEDMYDSIRGFKHDFNNIVQAIGGYISTNDMRSITPAITRVDNMDSHICFLYFSLLSS